MPRPNLVGISALCQALGGVIADGFKHHQPFVTARINDLSRSVASAFRLDRATAWAASMVHPPGKTASAVKAERVSMSRRL